MDRPVRRAVAVPLIVLSLLDVALAASNATQIVLSFQSHQGIVFTPLKYAAGLELYGGDSQTLNITSPLTLKVYANHARLAINSQTVNTTAIFQMLSLTLRFNSTQVSLNGLQNQSLGLDLNKGFYVISGTLAFVVLAAVNDSMTSSWTISITGT